ncbi:MAG: type 4a pilus biogenesis protein PilO, partial [Candidatus Omnitrophica bacterium]|nr:type 4a pilus biogenesis protein PilO [Candidatus Omnitrophota bacterium]
LNEMKKEMLSYEKLLPGQKDFPELLDGLASVAKNSGVTIQAIIPGKLSAVGPRKGESDFLKAMPVVISAKSGYHELGRFISDLESANRFISLENLSLKYDKRTPRLHDIRIVLKTYVSTED